ncbi:MAG: hypothetical protein AAF581_08810 [Planctomycetota bacterium]
MYRWVGYLLVIEAVLLLLLWPSLPVVALMVLPSVWAGVSLPRRQRWAHVVALVFSWLVLLHGVTTLVAFGVGAAAEPHRVPYGWGFAQACIAMTVTSVLGATQLWVLWREQKRDPSLESPSKYRLLLLSSSIAVLALATLVVTPRLYVGICPWSKMDCAISYVDITSGFKKRERYFWYVKVSEATEPTYLSRLLGKDLPESPDWRAAHTSTPSQRHSPHHTFHSALHQIRSLASVVDVCALPDDVARAHGAHILQLWQEDLSDRSVNAYIYTIHKGHGPDPDD